MKRIPVFLLLSLLLSSCVCRQNIQTCTVNFHISQEEENRIAEAINDQSAIIYLEGSNLTEPITPSGFGAVIRFENVPPGTYDVIIGCKTPEVRAVWCVCKIDIKDEKEDFLFDRQSFSDYESFFSQDFIIQYERFYPINIPNKNKRLYIDFIPVLADGGESKERGYFTNVTAPEQNQWKIRVPFMLEGFYNVNLVGFDLRERKYVYYSKKIHVKRSDKKTIVITFGDKEAHL